MSNKRYYGEIFDYLRGNASLPSTEAPAVVFGRKDVLVARRAGELIAAGMVSEMVITGGIGKDSGDLVDLGFASEASYLKHHLDRTLATQHLDHMPLIHLDEEAKNGGDNARNSLGILSRRNLITPSAGMIAVAHATSALRLAGMLEHTADKQNLPIGTVHVAPTNYNFDPFNPVDQAEARAELLRIADWPAKDWLLPRQDVPQHLVDFARHA